MEHYESYVIRYCGPRGSGKSLMLAYTGVQDLWRGRRVWSNMPIKIGKEFAREHGDINKSGLKTEPLDWNALYSLDKGLTKGSVIIDEAQYFSDSRSSNSLKNRLLNAIVAQVRKRSLNLYYSVKVGDWVDKRLIYESDISVDCENLSYSDWGREYNVPSGAVVFLRYYDLSGVVTGHAVNKDYWKPYEEKLFVVGRQVWGCYDTSQDIDLEDAFTNIKLDLRQRVISNKRQAGDIVEGLYQVADAIRAHRGTMVSTSEYWNLAEAMGVEGSSRQLGHYLRDLGIIRKQQSGGSYYYDLSNLQKNSLGKITEGA